MDINILKTGASVYNTPMYVFNIDEMNETVRGFREIIGTNADICYAMKANTFITGYMSAVTDRIEVCSMGEFHICRLLNIPPEKILISGVLKKKEDIYEILDYYQGKCAYTIESLTQLSYFCDWSNNKKEKICVYLRLTSGNQFGMDETTIEKVINKKNKYPYLTVKGIHYFSGTQKKTMEKIKGELNYLDTYLTELKEKAGFHAEELEYGPGFFVSYFQGGKEDTKEDIRILSEAVSKMQYKGRITLEMGRALAASCGYYLSRVCDTKKNNGENYCIVDGGINQLHYDGQICGMKKPYFEVISDNRNENQENWTVCGSLCTANDLLIKNVHVNNLKTGDIFVFKRVGAYSATEGMALFLSHELPKVLLYGRNMGWRLVRKEYQTYGYNMEKETEK